MDNHIDMEEVPKTNNDLESLMEVQDDNTFSYCENLRLTEKAPSGNQDVDMTEAEDKDRARSEVQFSFKVENIRSLKETALSPPHYARNLPWKIMVMPRFTSNTPGDRQQQKCIGFFLQCNGETESSAWSCFATAELMLLPQKPGAEVFSRRISHLFFAKENDWGFSHFMLYTELLDPDKGFVKDDSVIFEVHVTADAPHGVCWDSKKHTGFVGLKNQGATCYMNSLLQTLYFTNQLRKAVYKMPTESDDSNKSVALALQRVFHELQFSDKPVGTKKLTKSFGWETLDSFMQHDVQEFLRVLLDKLEIKMKGTCVEGTVPELFEGKMVSFIKCKSVEYCSSRAETFYDIQLNVKGKKDILESFKDYVEPEVLEGDNKYDAGIHGLQDAEKGVVFEVLPPVLHLHLMRFQYDPVTDCSVKFNDRFEFYEKIELDEFLRTKGITPATYILHAVLVHSGDNHGGHYVVYINPKGDGKWCKFDDDVVSQCSVTEAVTNNFGGNDDDSNIAVKHSSNAYMLVYIRESQLQTVLQEVTELDIPEELEERLKEEKNIEGIKRKERNEAHLYMTVNVYLEEMFAGYQRNDLCDSEKCIPRLFRVKKNISVETVREEIAKALGYPIEQIRLWQLSSRPNTNSLRPAFFDVDKEAKKNLSEIPGHFNPWSLWVETLSPESTLTSLPPFDKDTDVLLFFKLYDPKRKQISYLGHTYMPMTESLDTVVKLMNERAGFRLDTKLLLFEELQLNSCKPISSDATNLKQALENLSNGDILVFQRKDVQEFGVSDLPTAADYFEDLYHRVEVIFLDKTIPNDDGFMLELSQNLPFNELVTKLAYHLNMDEQLLQVLRCHQFKDLPGQPVPHDFSGILKEILSQGKAKHPRKVYYQKLSIPVNELANKRPFKISWLSPKLKEEKELTMYVNKNSTLAQFFEEAKKDENIELLGPDQGGSGELRLLDISNYRISQEIDPNSKIEQLCTIQNKTYRLEEIPLDEANLEWDEVLVPVGHYHRDPYSAFGVPFFLKVKQNEKFSKVKERLAKKLNIQEKEFEKFKFSIINNGRSTVIEEESDLPVNLQTFRANLPFQDIKTWLGLDHINKAPKRSRINYLEKAIKIYN